MSKGQYDEWNTNCIEHMDNMIRRKYEVLDPFFINVRSGIPPDNKCLLLRPQMLTLLSLYMTIVQSTNSLLKFFKSFSEKLVMFEPSLERLIETQKSHDYEAQYRDEDEADVSDELRRSSHFILAVSSLNLSLPFFVLCCCPLQVLALCRSVSFQLLL